MPLDHRQWLQYYHNKDVIYYAFGGNEYVKQCPLCKVFYRSFLNIKQILNKNIKKHSTTFYFPFIGEISRIVFYHQFTVFFGPVGEPAVTCTDPFGSDRVQVNQPFHFYVLAELVADVFKNDKQLIFWPQVNQRRSNMLSNCIHDIQLK